MFVIYMKRKKVKVYTDSKGQYIRTANGKKVRIVSKHPLSERELVKFLVKHLKPNRRRNKGKKEAQEKKYVDKAESSTSSAIINANDKINAMQRVNDSFRQKVLQEMNVPKIDDKKEETKLVKYEPEKMMKDFDELDDNGKLAFLAQHPQFGKVMQDLGKKVADFNNKRQKEMDDLKKKQQQEMKALKKKQQQAEKDTIVAELKLQEEKINKMKDDVNKLITTEEKKIYDYNKMRDLYTISNLKEGKKNKTADDFKKILIKNKLIETPEQIASRIIDDSKIPETKIKIKTMADRLSALEQQEGNDDDIEAEEKGGRGKRSSDDDGLTNVQIDNMMKKYKEYLGTIAHNEIPTVILPKVKARSRGCFIINTDSRSEKGLHWQCLYFDSRKKVGSNSIEFYDSYGDEPDSVILRGMKEIVDKLNAPTLLKYKSNKIVQQNNTSGNCGYFCVNYLQKRLEGQKFSEVTGYNDSVRGEKNIEAFKKRLNIKPFDYFPDDSQDGGNRFTDWVKDKYKKANDAVNSKFDDMKERIQQFLKGPRAFAPPSVRKFITENGELTFTEMHIQRKPTEVVKKFANWISGGKFSENMKRLNYDDVYHLYMWVKLSNGWTLKIEKNQVVEIKFMKFDPQAQSMQVNVPANLTVQEMLLKAEDAVTPEKLWIYHPVNANCQYFIKWCLQSSGMWNNQLETFVMQDSNELLRGIESIGEKGKSLTDLASRIDILISGKGHRKKKRKN